MSQVAQDKNGAVDLQNEYRGSLDCPGFCITVKEYSNPIIVVIPENLGERLLASVIAHEAIHAMEHICDFMGQPFGNEFVAYGVEGIVETVCSKVKV